MESSSSSATAKTALFLCWTTLGLLLLTSVLNVIYSSHHAKEGNEKLYVGIVHGHVKIHENDRLMDILYYSSSLPPL